MTTNFRSVPQMIALFTLQRSGQIRLFLLTVSIAALSTFAIAHTTAATLQILLFRAAQLTKCTLTVLPGGLLDAQLTASLLKLLQTVDMDVSASLPLSSTDNKSAIRVPESEGTGSSS